jgi:hypothetical protein
MEIIDRTTAQDFMPKLIHPSVFSGFNRIRTRKRILDEAMSEMGSLTLPRQTERSILAKAGCYRTKDSIIKSFTEYAVVFPAKKYLDHFKDANGNSAEVWGKNLSFSNDAEIIEQALRMLRLTPKTHSLAYAILCEASAQKNTEGLFVPKKRLIESLGYRTDQKHAYKSIKNALLSLRWTELKIFDRVYTPEAKIIREGTAKTTGSFLTALSESPKAYTVDINPIFSGCVSNLWGKTIKSRDEIKERFARGYFKYTPSILRLSAAYSSHGYLLTQFLVRDSGNRKIKMKGLKPVRYEVQRFIGHMQIRHSRPNRQYALFLKALKEIQIIKKLEPSRAELSAMRPKTGLTRLVTIAVPKNGKALDAEVENIIAGKK